MEAVVLAGGFGTRLRSVVSDLPKPMAPVNGRPFLTYVLDSLSDSGFESAILAIGYRGSSIRDYFGLQYRGLRLRYSVEEDPLGTGGAIRLALEQASAAEVSVVNGDTYLQVDYRAMREAHGQAGAVLTVAVHRVVDVSRYGALEVEGERIRSFNEKGHAGPGLINAGVYLLSRHLFDPYALVLPRAFSFEADVLVPHLAEFAPLAFEVDGAFIDIGVPEDYARATVMLAATSR